MSYTEKISTFELLKRKFPDGQYALLKEVSDKAGFRNGSCDFMSIGLWPSRGLEITGIELKRYRNDWLNELKNPAKAEAFYKHCDRWYLLIADETIAKLEEIPPTWGLMCIKGKRIITLKEAPKLNPESISRSFLAALMKRATMGLIDPSTIQGQISTAVELAVNQKESMFERERQNFEEMRNRVQDFEKASGISIQDRWRYHNAEKMGKIVEYVLRNEGKDFKQSLENAKEEATKIAQKIDSILTEIKDERPVQP